MSTDGRTAEPESASVALESATFVRLVTRADGDALAASGLLAGALADREVPFQVTVGRTVAERTDRAAASGPDADRNGDVTLVVGTADADRPQFGATDRPATLDACEVVRDLGATPDPILALAGLTAAGTDPGAGESEWLLEAARDRGRVERRPGLVVPTQNPIDGVAHSTRVRAPWSGDPDAARDALAAVGPGDGDVSGAFDADDHRRIGSAVALDVVGAGDATTTAAATVQQALRPYATPEGPFATIGGYADVLAATARTEPGTGAALAMGHDAGEAALAAWRDYGRRAHAALADASTGRYDGLFVVSVDDGPVEAIARVVAGYLSPEPVVLVVSEGHRPSGNQTQSDEADGEAALAARDDTLGATVEGVARELAAETDREIEYDAVRRRGYLRYDPAVDESTIVETVRAFQ
ncbi:exonuclease [Halosolutus halophilus]|uniref:exonuclease n=1 Tax=Halosolutus halophilus TaxID=1552990 RepID=UPI00223506D2|nr:exonuclease [Halosolutus halophilus]